MQSYENIYCEKMTIPSYMVDGKLGITPTFLLNIMQEVAVNHVGAIGCGWNFLQQRGQFWALSRMDVLIERRPRWREQVIINTWGKKHNFLVQPRDFLVETEDGEPLVRATSNWVILDFNGKPCELSSIEPLLKNQPNFHSIEKPATRLRQFVELGNTVFHPVEYSRIDMNCHANNGSYVHWVMDSFDYAFHQTHELKSISLNYLQQTKPTDRYAVAKKEIEAGLFLCSIYSETAKIEVCRVLTQWT